MKCNVSVFSALVLLSGCALRPGAPQITGAPSTPVSPEAVKLYAQKCMPANYEPVAKLDASMLGNFSYYQFNLHWIQELRKQAAALGANALEVVPIGHGAQGGGRYTIYHGPAFQVLAIQIFPLEAVAAGTSLWATPCAQEAGLFRYKLFHAPPGMGCNEIMSDARQASRSSKSC